MADKSTEPKGQTQLSPQDVVHILQGRARWLIDGLDAFPDIDAHAIRSHIAGMHDVAGALAVMMGQVAPQLNGKSDQPSKAN